MFASERHLGCMVMSSVLGAGICRMKSLLLLLILCVALGHVIIQKEVRIATTTIIIIAL